MSCSSAATISTSGRATCRISADGLDAGLDHVPVDGEPVDRRRVRQQPDPLPLGQDPRQRAGLLERLPDRQQPAARRRAAGPAACRASRGHGSGSGAALARQPGRGRRAPARRRARRPRRPRAAAAAGPRRAGVPRSSTTSPPASATPGRDRLQVRAPRRPTAAGRRQHGVHPPPGQPRQVGDPAAELAHVPLRRLGVGQPEPLGAGRPTARARPGRWPRPATSCSTSRTSSSASRRALEVDVRHVDQPGRDQRLEHGRVAQPALGLLEVGHRQRARARPSARAAPATSARSAGSRSRASRRQCASIVGAQPQGQVRVAGEVPHVEQPERDPQVGVRLRRVISGACAPSGRASRRSPTAGTRPARPPRRRSTLGVVDQHHVEVGVRRQLAPPVAADGDQRAPGLGRAAAAYAETHSASASSCAAARSVRLGRCATTTAPPAC